MASSPTSELTFITRNSTIIAPAQSSGSMPRTPLSLSSPTPTLEPPSQSALSGPSSTGLALTPSINSLFPFLTDSSLIIIPVPSITPTTFGMSLVQPSTEDPPPPSLTGPTEELSSHLSPSEDPTFIQVEASDSYGQNALSCCEVSVSFSSTALPLPSGISFAPSETPTGIPLSTHLRRLDAGPIFGAISGAVLAMLISWILVRRQYKTNSLAREIDSTGVVLYERGFPDQELHHPSSCRSPSPYPEKNLPHNDSDSSTSFPHVIPADDHPIGPFTAVPREGISLRARDASIKRFIVGNQGDEPTSSLAPSSETGYTSVSSRGSSLRSIEAGFLSMIFVSGSMRLFRQYEGSGARFGQDTDFVDVPPAYTDA